MAIVDRVVERVRRAPPIVVDASIAAWILVIQSAGIILGWVYWHDPLRVGPFGLLALATLGVTLRRKIPWLAYFLVWLALAGGLVLKTAVAELAMLVALYTLAEQSPFGVSLLALLAALAADYLAVFPEDALAGFRFISVDVAQLVLSNWVWLALAWLAGLAQARRRAIASDLKRIVDALQRERERLARTALAMERRRIARELHALVLRGIEEMQVKTRAARRGLGDAASHVPRTIGDVEAIGRRTLVEMRRLLLILRADQESGGSSEDLVLPTAGGSPSSDGPPPPRPPDSRQDLAAKDILLARRWIAVPWRTDALIVLVMAVLAAAEPFVKLWIYWDVGDPSAPWPINTSIYVPTAVVLVGAFLFRRKAPLLVFAVIASVLFVENAFPLGGGAGFTGDRAMFVAVFTVAAFRGPRWGMIALSIMLLTLGRALLTLGNLGWELVWTSQTAFAVIAGVAVRESRRLNEELREQSETLRRTRQERIRRAVDEERSRIARDVHDMVAHGVTLMVIQAGAARWLAVDDPTKADHALGSVERAGQDALRELNSLVGSLGSSSPDGAEPLPEADHLTIASLVDRAVHDGMHVELVVRAEPAELDAGLEISLYRIVQEALTNVRKHAPAARVCVELAYTPVGVDVDVSDTGESSENGRARTVPGAGQGLVGIAERAALFGGCLEAGPTPEGGFRVHASLVEERVPV